MRSENRKSKRLAKLADDWRLNDAGRDLLADLPALACPPAPRPSQNLEDEALRRYRQAATTRSEPWRKWVLAGAVLSGLTLIAVGLWPHPAPQTAPAPSATIAAKALPATYAPGGLVYHASVLAQSGQATLAPALESQHLLRHGTTIATPGAQSALALRVDGRVLLTLLPESELRFEESERQLVPRLLKGTLLVDVELSGLAPAWLVLGAGTRVLDIGTRYLFAQNPGGERRLKVESGRVRLTREVGGDSELLAGQALSWRPGTASFTVSREPQPAPEFALAQRLLAPPADRHPVFQAPVAEPETPPEVLSERSVKNEPSSWERTLDALEPLKRDSIERYLGACEKTAQPRL